MPSPLRRFQAALLVLAGSFLPTLGEAESPEPRWGLPADLLAGLAEQADAYLELSYRFTCVETSRSVRYRPGRPIFRERKYEYAPSGIYRGNTIPEFRLQITPEGRAGKPVRAKPTPFPTANDWTQLFSVGNQPLFMYRELGVRLDGLDLVRVIEFRGWLPFTDGRDIREWEGTVLVESTRLRTVEISARPRNQAARLAFLYDRWARSWKISLGLFAGPLFFPIKTFRTAPKPLAYHCHVRFDHWQEEIRLPTLLRYETHQAVSPQRTERRRVSTRFYSGYSRLCGETEAIEPISTKEKKGLLWAGAAIAAVLSLWLATVLPENGLLRHPDPAMFWRSNFFRGLVPILFTLFVAGGVAYGYATGSIRKADDIIGFMAETMKRMAPFVVLVLVMSQFTRIFQYANFDQLIAIQGAEGLRALGFGEYPIPFFVAFILIIAVANLFMGSASAKWAIFAPIFAPMFLTLGYHPAFTQLLYRVGDSITNCVSPLYPYFPLLLGWVAAMDRSKSKVGTVLSWLVPYSLFLLAGWIVMLVVWYLLGLPVGPDSPIRLDV